MEEIKFYFRTFDHAQRAVLGLMSALRDNGRVSFNEFLDICRPGSFKYDIPNTGHCSEWYASNFIGLTTSIISEETYFGRYKYTVSLPMPKPVLTFQFHTNSLFKAALPKAAKDAKIQKAYNILTKAVLDKDAETYDLVVAMEEAIGYLGEVLE